MNLDRYLNQRENLYQTLKGEQFNNFKLMHTKFTNKNNIENFNHDKRNDKKNNKKNNYIQKNQYNQKNQGLNKSKFINCDFRTSGKIIAIGDVHGDWKATINSFLIENLVKKQGRKWVWNGGNTIVVQLGDQVDRKIRTNDNVPDEASEKKIMKFFDNMHNQALEYGGAVLSLIGNHELMNVNGDFSYSSDKNIEDFGGIVGRINAFKPGGKIATYLANNRYAMVRVNDWLFVHGGITPEIVKNYTIHEINYLVKEYLLGNIDDNPKLHYLIHDNDSIFWDRSLAGDQENINKKNLAYILKNMKVKGIVIGHTPQHKINSIFNGKVWRVDVGSSRSFGKGNRVDVLTLQ